jgi:ubiquinone/menaquinone biosynthesis C-methylase UbiE
MLASFNAQFAHPNGWLGHLAGWPILSPTTGDKIVVLKNRERNAWAIELLDVRPTDHILEIGFGPGWAIQQLVPLVRDGLITGIDSSAAMLRQARQRNVAALRSGRAELHLGPNAPLPFPEAHFHKALAVNSTQFWSDLPAGLREFRRVLKPDGRVILTYQPPSGTDDDARAMGEQLVTHLQNAGFRHVRLETKALRPIMGVSVIGIK